MADAGGVKSDGACPLAAATLSGVKPMGAEDGNDRRYMFNCECMGKPLELVGRDGGLEGGFDEKGTECEFTTLPGLGPTEVGKG